MSMLMWFVYIHIYLGLFFRLVGLFGWVGLGSVGGAGVEFDPIDLTSCETDYLSLDGGLLSHVVILVTVSYSLFWCNVIVIVLAGSS